MKLRLLLSLLLLSALLLVKQTVAQTTPNTPVGDWQGKLKVPGAELRIVFHIKSTAPDVFSAILDSPDQGASGIPVNEVVWRNDTLKLMAKGIGGEYIGRFKADSLLFEGAWKQGGQSFPLNIKKTDAAALTPRRTQVPQKPYPYREEEVSYHNPQAGVKLAGTLTLPQGKGPFPVVLLITGSGPQNRDEELMGHQPFLVLADYLTRRGIAVLRVDDRGVGKSTGNFAKATSEDFAADALAGVSFLKNRKEINPKQIGLIGHSEGGMIAPMVASRSKDVVFIVLMAGVGTRGDELLKSQTALILRANGVPEEQIQRTSAMQNRIFKLIQEEKDAAEVEEKMKILFREEGAKLSEAERQAYGYTEATASAQAKQFSSPWFRYFLTYNPVPILQKVRCPVLALNGEKDLQVPPKENLSAIEKALKVGGNQKVTVRELPSLNHLFQTAKTGGIAEYAQIEETIAPVALQIMGDWIVKQTGK